MSEKTDEFILVKSGVQKRRDGGAEIIISEKDDRHPKGHLLVSSPDRFSLAFPTAAVREAVTKGRLIEASAEDRGAITPEERERILASAGFQKPTAEGKARDLKSDKNDSVASGAAANPAAGGGADKNAEVSLEAGDSPETLDARYNRQPLFDFATTNGVQVAKGATKTEIIAAIFAAQQQ